MLSAFRAGSAKFTMLVDNHSELRVVSLVSHPKHAKNILSPRPSSIGASCARAAEKKEAVERTKFSAATACSRDLGSKDGKPVEPPKNHSIQIYLRYETGRVGS